MNIAASLCVYTNSEIVIEELYESVRVICG